MNKKEFRTIIFISNDESERIERYLTTDDPDECQGEDNTIVHTAKFPDGREMDIKCCGCDDDNSWTEAVLFDVNGSELCCSEVFDEYTGSWELEYNGTIYAVNVLVVM